ncbi:MAG: SHOCT domain-containing protein [Acidiferrobacter sp.]
MWINGGAGMMAWGWIFPVLFLVAMVFVMVFVMRSRGGGPGCGTHRMSSATAREELDRRYARGEVTRDQYQQMRKDLE